VADGVVAGVELLAELLQLDFFDLDHLIATLPLFEKLDDAASEPLEVIEHDQSLDVSECLLSTRIKVVLWGDDIAKSRSDYA